MFRIAASVVLGALLLAGVSSPARAGSPDMSGSWVYDTAQSEDVEAAIKNAVEKVNFIIRGFAHGRLKNTNQPYRKLAIIIQGAEVQIKKDARPAIKAPLDGTVIKWRREDDQVYDLSIRRHSKVFLEESIGNAEGKRVNSYKLRPDANTLDLFVKVTSPKLPVPLEYRLGYRRIP